MIHPNRSKPLCIFYNDCRFFPDYSRDHIRFRYKKVTEICNHISLQSDCSITLTISKISINPYAMKNKLLQLFLKIFHHRGFTVLSSAFLQDHQNN